MKGVTKMKTVYQNELIKVNKEIWENDIRKEISDWEDFPLLVSVTQKIVSNPQRPSL